MMKVIFEMTIIIERVGDNHITKIHKDNNTILKQSKKKEKAPANLR
jgi:hypothetical protein